jgi:Glycerophosphoryl diester phosphodiesterase family
LPENETSDRTEESKVKRLSILLLLAAAANAQVLTVPHLDPSSVLSNIGKPNPSLTFVIAHRGNHSLPLCAENSPCSIAEAYNAGADAIEIDVKVSQDDVAVTGHDVSVGRELARSSSFSPFDNFPYPDQTYFDPARLPFLNNMTKECGAGSDSNPRRQCMTQANISPLFLKDTYNIVTPEKAGTLQSDLEIIATSYPMLVWLDVKDWNSVLASEKAVVAARKQYPGNSALRNYALKYAWTTAKDHPNLRSELKDGSVFFFLVVGVSDFDSMATYNTANPKEPLKPTNDTEARRNIILAANYVCNPSNGCLGVELADKYSNSPSQFLYEDLKMKGITVAGFHTVQQYGWYWQNLPDLDKFNTWGRWFPRTDGSCCFALTDGLNASSSLQAAEVQDLRDTFSWNEDRFSAITTDEPRLMLAKLESAGKRKFNGNITGINLQYPSGGAKQIGHYTEGVYYISSTTRPGSECFLTWRDTAPTQPICDGDPKNKKQWYLRVLADQHYQIWNELGMQLDMTVGQVNLEKGATGNYYSLWVVGSLGGNSC